MISTKLIRAVESLVLHLAVYVHEVQLRYMIVFESSSIGITEQFQQIEDHAHAQ